MIPAVQRLRPELRFWSLVDRSGPCWLWRGRINDGYGKSKKLGETMAHRVAWRLVVGPIPAGMELDHLCRVRNCVNPAHLEPVTPRENTLRSDGVTARRARQTHCVHGHAFDAANTITDQRGHRACRTCGRGHQRRRRERLRALRMVEQVA